MTVSDVAKTEVIVRGPLASSAMTKSKRQTQKPSVVIIGPGRLGLALTFALQESGYPILAVVARRIANARKAVHLLNESETLTLALGIDQLEKLPLSDLIIITTPDDVIAKTARRLTSCQGLIAGSAKKVRQGSSVLHTSGALSSEALSSLVDVGFHTGSIHPLVSVSEPLAGARALHGAYFCLEGDPTALKLAGGIVHDLSGKSFSIRSESKSLYHAAALMTAGHAVALFDLTTTMLAACGLSRGTAQRILLPLMESAISNLKTSEPAAALTGTFSRGDEATVRRHLQALSQGQFPAALDVYRLLGQHSLDLAKNNGLDPQVVRRIKNLLESENPANK